MRDALDQLHFTGAGGDDRADRRRGRSAASRSRCRSAGIKAVIVALLLFITSPVLSHATARSARIREHGRWRCSPTSRGRGGAVTVLQVVVLVLVALSALAVVAARDPCGRRWWRASTGSCSASCSSSSPAPDVALSQTVVGAVALPLMILLALAKVARRRANELDGAAGTCSSSSAPAWPRCCCGLRRAARLRRTTPAPYGDILNASSSPSATTTAVVTRGQLRLPRRSTRSARSSSSSPRWSGVASAAARPARGARPAPGRRRARAPRAPIRASLSRVLGARAWSARRCWSASTWSPTGT